MINHHCWRQTSTVLGAKQCNSINKRTQKNILFPHPQHQQQSDHQNGLEGVEHHRNNRHRHQRQNSQSYDRSVLDSSSYFVRTWDNNSSSSTCLSVHNSYVSGTLFHTMGKPVRTCPHMLLLVACTLCLSSICMYRAYKVLHRSYPPELDEVEMIRWLDELGRLALGGHSWVHDWMGMDAGIEPIKTFINTAFSLLFNPWPTQRLVYRNIRPSQDVYSGVPVSTYTPINPTAADGKHSGLYPTIVYFHGGGWTWLSVGVYDGPLKHLANSTNFKVIAVEYRKAPEHPFPAAFEDCLAVSKYIWRHAKELHIKQDSIVVAGDGAGGNLAAAVAHEMMGQIRLQILISPALQMLNMATPSYQDYSEHLMPGITSPKKEVTNWMRYANIDPEYRDLILNNSHVPVQHYKKLSDHIDSKRWLPKELINVTKRFTKHIKILDIEKSVPENLVKLILDSRFSPMFRSDLRNSPPAYILTAQYDVLRDEALMYGQRLKESGVDVAFRHYWSGFHGFFMFAGGGWLELAVSKLALEDLVCYLDTHILSKE